MSFKVKKFVFHIRYNFDFDIVSTDQDTALEQAFILFKNSASVIDKSFGEITVAVPYQGPDKKP